MSSNSTCPSPGVFGTCLTRLSTGQAVGLMIDFEAGSVSFLAVLIFMTLIFRNVIRHYKNPPAGSWSLLRTHIDAYILSLMAFELIHSIAAMMNIKWVHTETVSCGTYCNIQGATRNVGSAGVALVTLAIAVHTFAVIFFQWIPSRSLLLPISVLSGIWVFLIAFISVQLVIPRAPDAPFYGPTPYWCWIGPSYTAEQIWGQYLWMWLAAFMSIVLYVPLYFCVKGNLSYRPSARWKIRITRTPKLVGDDAPMLTHAAKMATKDAMCMLYYPVAYVLLVLPLSIVRFMSEEWQQQGKHFPVAPKVMGSAVFGLSGIVNVLLFVLTRPNLLLFRSQIPQPPRRAKAPNEDALLWQRQGNYPLYPSYPPPTGSSMFPLEDGSRRLQNAWDIEFARGNASR